MLTAQIPASCDAAIPIWISEPVWAILAPGQSGSAEAVFAAKEIRAATAMNAETVIFVGFSLYAVVGVGVAVAFVTWGVGRVLGHVLGTGPAPTVALTFGARLLILPGAAALWPYVLLRWCRACRT
jgi:hypothetical protein